MRKREGFEGLAARVAALESAAAQADRLGRRLDALEDVCALLIAALPPACRAALRRDATALERRFHAERPRTPGRWPDPDVEAAYLAWQLLEEGLQQPESEDPDGA